MTVDEGRIQVSVNLYKHKTPPPESRSGVASLPILLYSAVTRESTNGKHGFHHARSYVTSACRNLRMRQNDDAEDRAKTHAYRVSRSSLREPESESLCAVSFTKLSDFDGYERAASSPTLVDWGLSSGCLASAKRRPIINNTPATTRTAAKGHAPISTLPAAPAHA